jgi:hypothetical protein
MKNLVIGYGEVGQAISRVLNTNDVIDKNSGIYLKNGPQEFDTMHICFPYTAGEFEKEVTAYQNTFRPKITIIHSSVPLGTSDKLNAVHSPIRGVHPHLEKGIRTFVKYFGGFKAHEAAAIFAEKGIETRVIRDARTTEASKLWDTTQYGIMILLEKEIYKFCRDNGLDFEVVYASFNETYNEGYRELGMGYVNRPALMHKDGKIGGHCVVENAALLDTDLARLIIEKNSLL